MMFHRHWKKLALFLLIAVAANAAVAAAPAHVFAATPQWSAPAHDHSACCPALPDCGSGCPVTSHCSVSTAALPASQQAAAERTVSARLFTQSLHLTSDAAGVEAPPPRL